MWNAKRLADKAADACSRCSSSHSTNSTAGAALTRSASTTLCSTSNSGVRPPGHCLEMQGTDCAHEAPALQVLVQGPGYPARVSDAIARLSDASGPAQAQACVVDGIAALGIEHAFFATLVLDERGVAACRLMLACDPHPFRRPLDDWTTLSHPWLAYAALHAEPVDANDPWLHDIGGVPASAELWGREFTSALLFPAHAGPGHAGFGLLALGSSQPRFFKGPGLARLRQGARALACELQDWWMAHERQHLVATARVSPFELDLLRHARQGQGSKQIARALDSTVGAVNSRFQRLNSRLGVGNRRAAARLAVACRLLPF